MTDNILGLDYGAKRIGVAIADQKIAISQPRPAISNDANAVQAIHTLSKDNYVSKVVVGLPRNLDGNETSQTKLARDFAEQLKTQIDIPVYLIDEAVTSRQAEDLLKQSGKPYSKGDIDSLAAALILDNFLSSYEAH